MLCGSCTRWDCLPEDIFCGFCGHPAKRLEITPPAAVFVGGQRAKPLRLTLGNRGTSHLRVRIGQPRATREWLKLIHPAVASETERKRVGWTKMVAAVEDGKLLAHPHIDAEVNLPPGADYGFDVSVEGRLAVPEKDLSSVLLLSGEGLADLRGNPVHTRRLAVTWGVAPEPRLAAPQEVSAKLGGRGTPFDVRVVNPRRGFLTLREVPKVSVPWITVADFPHEPIMPGAEAAISLVTDPNWAPSGVHKVEVTVSPLEVEKPLTATFQVSVRMAPQILVSQSMMTFADLTPYSDVPQQLVIENRGEEELVLLGEPTVEPASLRANLKIKDDDPTYRRIKSARDGNRGKVISVVASGKGLAPGEHTGTIRVVSNDPTQEVAEVRVTLQVKKLEKSELLLSLDFGTSNSCIAAAFGPADWRVIDLSGGGREKLYEIPTVVYFRGPDDFVIGEEAKNVERAHPDRTISSIKRRLASVKPIKILGREYTPLAIATIIIKKLRERAAVALGAEPAELVLTVPCHFGREGIDTLLAACREAGFEPRPEPRFVMDEPSAAAYPYLVLSRDDLIKRGNEHRVLVYDFGGGTLDIALLEVRFGSSPRTYIRVIDVDGLDLGGDDMDQDLLDLYLERLACDQSKNAKSKLSRVDLDRIKQQLEGEADLDTLANRTILRRTAEDVKKRLSVEDAVPFPSVGLKDRLSGMVYLDKDDTFLSVKRGDFEHRVKPRLDAANEVVRRVLERSHVKPEEIDTLLLTGGSSRMPLVRTMVSGMFPKAYVPTPEEIPPKQSVALGAVVHGYLANFERGQTPEVVIEPMRDRAFFSIGTLNSLGQFREIVPRGGLPLFGEYEMALPEAPYDLHLVRNNGTTDPRFQEKRTMQDIGKVRIDPGQFPQMKRGADVTLELFLHADRKLEAKIGQLLLPVQLREGALK